MKALSALTIGAVGVLVFAASKALSSPARRYRMTAIITPALLAADEEKFRQELARQYPDGVLESLTSTDFGTTVVFTRTMEQASTEPYQVQIGDGYTLNVVNIEAV